MPYTSEVFGVSPQINMYSYFDRSNLDVTVAIWMENYLAYCAGTYILQ